MSLVKTIATQTSATFWSFMHEAAWTYRTRRFRWEAEMVIWKFLGKGYSYQEIIDLLVDGTFDFEEVAYGWRTIAPKSA